MPRRHERAPRGADLKRQRRRPDERDRADLRGVERQRLTIVLEQHERLEGRVERDLPVRVRVDERRVGRRVPVEDARAQDRPHDARCVGVDLVLADEAARERELHAVRREEAGPGHLEVVAGADGARRLMDAAPVRHHEPVEAPAAFEHVGE